MNRSIPAVLLLCALAACAPARSVDDQQMAQANAAADINAIKSKQQETRMRLEELEGRLGDRGDANSLQDLNARVSRLEETVARIAATLGVDTGARAPSAPPQGGYPASGYPSGPSSTPPSGAYQGGPSGAYQGGPSGVPSGGRYPDAYQGGYVAPSGNQGYSSGSPAYDPDDEDRPPNLPPVSGRSQQASAPGRYQEPSTTDPAEAVYNMAMESFNQRDYDRANSLYSELLKSYPNSRQAPGALFWQAEINFQQGDFARSALLCQDLIQKYPNSNMVPAAMLKQGLAFRKLNKNPAAKILFQDVVKRYPNSPEARSAQIQLREIK
ncbi:tol-pal system protein YbgF [Fundidesulfovibrio agrisoli]|uniref:tol-pal system protein YbgF n=1 Tax=Fundidesulfovibrio agrisoli TaxID=2922717 RepID=UPI001FABA0D4|nr:tol-pal system protein YbgF [Fundidesulfovibrio agrisoli]